MIEAHVVTWESDPQFAVLIHPEARARIQQRLSHHVAVLDDSVEDWDYSMVRELLIAEGFLCVPVAFFDEP